jgi:hypothetical protein
LTNYGSLNMRNISAVGNGKRATLANRGWKVTPVQLVPSKVTVPVILQTQSPDDTPPNKKEIAASPAGSTPGPLSRDGTSFQLKWVAVAKKGL